MNRSAHTLSPPVNPSNLSTVLAAIQMLEISEEVLRVRNNSNNLRLLLGKKGTATCLAIFEGSRTGTLNIWASHHEPNPSPRYRDGEKIWASVTVDQLTLALRVFLPTLKPEQEPPQAKVVIGIIAAPE